MFGYKKGCKLNDQPTHIIALLIVALGAGAGTVGHYGVVQLTVFVKGIQAKQQDLIRRANLCAPLPTAQDVDEKPTR